MSDKLYTLFKDELEDLGDANEEWWDNSFETSKISNVSNNILSESIDVENCTSNNYGDKGNIPSCDGSRDESFSKNTSRSESPELHKPCKRTKRLNGSFDQFNLSFTRNVLLQSYEQNKPSEKPGSSSDAENLCPPSISLLVGNQKELSWSSTLESPDNNSIVNITYSNLNTEERNTLLPKSDNIDISEQGTETEVHNITNIRDCFELSFDEQSLKENTIQNKVETSTEKSCCRKLMFGSPILDSMKNENLDINKASSINHSSYTPIRCISSSVTDILENLVSPVVRQDTKINSSSLEEITTKDSCDKTTAAIQEDNVIQDEAVEEEKISASSITSSSEKCFSKSCQEQDISFGVLEEICQASEMLEGNSTLTELSTTPGLKPNLRKYCTSTPLENVNKNAEMFGDTDKKKAENLSSLESNVKLMDADTNVTDSSLKPSIYSIFGKRNVKTIQDNSSSVEDILISAQLLEEGEQNRRKHQINGVHSRENIFNKKPGCSFTNFNSINKDSSVKTVFKNVEKKEEYPNELVPCEVLTDTQMVSISEEDQVINIMNDKEDEAVYNDSPKDTKSNFSKPSNNDNEVFNIFYDEHLNMEDSEFTQLHSGKEKSRIEHVEEAWGKDQFQKEELKDKNQTFSEEDISTSFLDDVIKITDHFESKVVTEPTCSKELFKSPLNNHPTFQSFTTASGKSVNVSQDALKKAKQLFQDEEIHLYKEKDKINESNIKTQQRKTLHSFNTAVALVKEDNLQSKHFNGFQTASGKTVEVSEDAFKKVKDIFSEENCTVSEICKLSVDKPVSSKFHIDQKYIKVHEDSMRKPKEMLVDESKTLPEKNSSESFASFSTASGKSVHVSENALKKAKTLFLDDFQKDTMIIEQNSSKERNIEPIKCGFSTASGKKVDISEDALVKARKLFEDDKSEQGCSASLRRIPQISKEEEITLNNVDITNKVHPKLEGFSTASGKSVSISEDSLKKVKRLFQDEKIETFQGFSTGSGKTVHVSKKALDTAKKIFSDDLLEEKGSAVIREPSFEPTTAGFSTASGKIVNISKNALEKAKQLFAEENEEKHEEFSKENQLGRFSSTGGKFEEDISKTRQLFSGNSFTGEKSKPLLKKVLEKSVYNENLKENSNTTNIMTSNLKSPTQNQRNILKDGTNSLLDSENELLSLAHEISESTAAFLCDEQMDRSDAPEWAQVFVTSPSFLNDRSIPMSPIICSDIAESTSRKTKRPASPVLGSGDRFKKKRRFSNRSQSFLTDSPVLKSNLLQSLVKSGPLKTSTPILESRSKRIFEDNHSDLLPKKLKLDFDMESEEDQTLMQILDTAEARRKATENQKELIYKRKNDQNIKPHKGSLLLKKEGEKRIILREAVGGKLPGKFSFDECLKLGVKKSVIEVTPWNAINFRFKATDYYSTEEVEKNTDGFLMSDGGTLILDTAGTVGVEEIMNAFLSSPGVAPSLVSEEWLKNHYRWIVLKMATMERSFPDLFANRYLSPDNVLLQLKYRYDREIDNCQRPCLRKILETDEAPGRAMVLCVGAINEYREKHEIELTDGWYYIKTTIDDEMADLIYRKKVSVGTKLFIQGAELLNAGDGCDPLQVGINTRLKIYTNNTRRAKWDTKLGFSPHQEPFLVKLNSVLPKGGLIGRIDALVAKIYPLVYRVKSSNGKTVMLSAKAEERESCLHQQKTMEELETMYSQVQKEIEAERKSSHRRKNIYREMKQDEIQSILTPEHLIDIIENTETVPTKEQQEIIYKYRQEEQEKMRNLIQKRISDKRENAEQRVSTPLLRVRLVDPVDPEGSRWGRWRSAVLSIWKPSEDLQSSFVDGAVVTIQNVLASGCRNGELQLSSSNKTRFLIKSHNTNTIQHNTTPLSTLRYDYRPRFSEFDAVGLIVKITVFPNIQNVYIADKEQCVLAISFWGAIQDFGWESVITIGSFLSCSNLHWRSGTVSWHIPYAYVSEITSFSLQPKRRHLQESLNRLKDELQPVDLDTFISECNKKIDSLLAQRESGGINNPKLNTNDSAKGKPELSTSYPESITDIPQKNAGENSFSELNKSSLISELKKDMRATLVQEKFKYLERYAEPPSITPLPLCCSPVVNKNFKSPRLQNVQNESPPYSSESDSENR